MKNVTVLNHPLIQHKTTILRQESTSNKVFRELIEEITMLMCYEALRDLPLEDVKVKTPLTETTQKMIKGKKLAIVPILRAGLGMVNGMLDLVPSAKVGHIGMYRDEETLEPHEYYCKLPEDIENRLIVVVDPMLATGGSAMDAISQIKSYGGKHIKFLCIIAAPEGIDALSKAHPDVEIYCANVDEKLNENGYIVPGLGDAGDRIFGTK
jgi:uracil phosphoribosyltransferase